MKVSSKDNQEKLLDMFIIIKLFRRHRVNYYYFSDNSEHLFYYRDNNFDNSILLNRNK